MLISALDDYPVFRTGARLKQNCAQPFDFEPPIVEPICAPNSMEVPSEVFQHFLPKPVAFPCPERAMICCAITLDRQNVSARLVGMPDAEIEAKASRTDLWIGEECGSACKRSPLSGVIGVQ